MRNYISIYRLKQLKKIAVTSMILASVTGCGNRESDSRDALTLLAMGAANPGGAGVITLSEEYYSGGGTTVFSLSSHAFSQPATNLTETEIDRHFDGDLAFETRFVVNDPGGAPDQSGLGPLFNNRACADCHLRDGRGRPEEGTGQRFGLLMKLSRPGAADGEAPWSIPLYGTQFQDNSIDGVASEGKVNISYTESAGSFSDGENYSLRTPTYTLQDFYNQTAWDAHSADVMISPRVAPPVFGSGLLEAITEEDIIANRQAQVSDASDSVAGIIQWVTDPEDSIVKIGRFARKGENPSVRIQSAGAYNQDMGITTSVFPGQNCREAGEQAQCNQPDGADISDQALNDAVFYSQTLAVPARRDVEAANVIRGKQQFINAGCAVCHVPGYTTGTHPDGIEALSNQKIWPYTDMLLHDMGPGLADNRPSFYAGATHWKTPALWGIGLTKTVNTYAGFLHDGRARTLTEAILWHGGEAENAKNTFKNLSREQRQDILDFLNSL
jgi:CxxC motif-containing protein (DUF1111 family)